MKTTIIFLLFLGTYQNSLAGTLPLKVTKNSQGEVDRIELLTNKKTESKHESNILSGLKLGFESLSTYSGKTFEAAKKLKPEEQAALTEALAEVSSRSFLMTQNEQQLVSQEFSKASNILKQKKWFTLIASPNRPQDFDEELALVEIVKQITSETKKVLGDTPAFSIFSFLLDEYINALVARREFFQNAFLVYLNSGKSEFSAIEIKLLKSSIFYSRIAIVNFEARKAAIKNWNQFGLDQESKWTKKCQANESVYMESCFKLENKKVRNILVNQHSLTKKSSIAFEETSPHGTGNIRWMILAVKLGVKLTPAPGFVKSAVNGFLNSLYSKQRTSEGLLFGAFILADKNGLAQVISQNNANPTF